MTGSKPSVRLTDEEIWQFLDEAHTGILCSLRGDGMPIMTPLWFAAIDGSIFFRTRSHLKKVTRLQRDARCAFLVESGKAWSELTAVHLTGRARLLDDNDPRLVEIADTLSRKYEAHRTPSAVMPDETRQAYSTPTVFVEIVPDQRILNWDNSRLKVS